MNLGFDLDGTVNKHPEFFKNIMEIWAEKGQRIILTARPMSESFITLKDLISMGITPRKHFDLLVMNPVQHLYDISSGVPIFWEDKFNMIYVDYSQREYYIELAKKNGAQHDIENMVDLTSKWKVDMCKLHKIEAIYEDNKHNIEALHKAGIYTLQVKGDYKND